MLWLWVVVLVALIGGIAVVSAGRGDSMIEVYDDRPDVSLPTGRPIVADDLRSLRFNTGVRGYRMDEVDAFVARLEAEMIEREDNDIRVLHHGDDLSAADRADPPPDDPPDDPADDPDDADESAASARFLEPTRVIEPADRAGSAKVGGDAESVREQDRDGE